MSDLWTLANLAVLGVTSLERILVLIGTIETDIWHGHLVCVHNNGVG